MVGFILSRSTLIYEDFCSHPSVAFAALKKKRSDVSVVSLSIEDPASHDGMIRIVEKLIQFLPKLPSGLNQKTLIFGDQLFVERGEIEIFSLVTFFFYGLID